MRRRGRPPEPAGRADCRAASSSAPSPPRADCRDPSGGPAVTARPRCTAGRALSSSNQRLKYVVTQLYDEHAIATRVEELARMAVDRLPGNFVIVGLLPLRPRVAPFSLWFEPYSLEDVMFPPSVLGSPGSFIGSWRAPFQQAHTRHDRSYVAAGRLVTFGRKGPGGQI